MGEVASAPMDGKSSRWFSRHMTNLGGSLAQCFISYHRPDNETYDSVVDRLANELKGRFAAQSGRSLEIFLDRDSIPGGNDWRDKIAEAIASATVFIPVVTMRYFQSDNCREELIAFYDGARRLGVTDLILPVILAGSENISEKDPRPEVRLIERLNYRSIEAAVDAGYQSPEWKSVVRTLVADVAKGLAAAESAIAKDESVVVDNDGEVGPGSSEAPEPYGDDASDIFEIQDAIAAATANAEKSSKEIEKLGEVVAGFSTELDGLESATAAQKRAVLLRMAGAISPVSKRLGTAGSALEAEVRKMDRQIRSTVDELANIDGEMARQLRATLVAPLGSMSTGDTPSQMDSMLNTLSTFGVLSVSLRKSIEPAVRGIRSVRNAASIAESWRSLA